MIVPGTIDLEGLVARARALRHDLDGGVDVGVYHACGRDPQEPLLCGGDLCADVGFWARDPGRDEVRHMTPLIGAAGKLVRAGVYRAHHGRQPTDEQTLREAGERVFLSNTVPFKPVGNKAWSMAVKRMFRPVMASLLVDCWSGRHLMTLGNVAFEWFAIDATATEKRALRAYWKREDRYTAAPFHFDLSSPLSGQSKTIALLPLPHPSPLNAVWYPKFPGLLDNRFQQLKALGLL